MLLLCTRQQEAKKEKKEKRKRESSDDEEAGDAKRRQPPREERASLTSATVAEVGKNPIGKMPIIKNIYRQDPAVEGMSASSVSELRGSRRTAVEGPGSGLNPVVRFDQCGFDKDVVSCTKAFSQPSPIQSQCWPIVLSGHDLIGIAATGSGKTLAFGLPALQHIRVQRNSGVVKGRGPVTLILAPTRELAMQIHGVLEDAGSACGIRAACIYGGVPKGPQLRLLREGADVVVATPGRLQDLMDDGSCDLSNVTFFVLDEADRMLDQGFEPAMRAIASQVRADRQTVMFSATWPVEVQRLANAFLAKPTKARRDDS